MSLAREKPPCAPVPRGSRVLKINPPLGKGRGGLRTWNKAVIPPRDPLLAPRRLPPECRDHEDAGLSVASRVRTLQLLQRGCRVQGPSPKVASRLSSALGMPAASSLLDLVPDGSWLYWRGWWGGRQTVNRPASRTGKAPESPGGTTSYVVHRARHGVGGPGGDEGDTPHLGAACALGSGSVGYANGAMALGGRRP